MTELAKEVEIEESEVEVIARQHGWVPQDEFTGDETNWVDAEKWESRSKRERLQEAEIAQYKLANAQSAEILKRLEEREHRLKADAETAALEKLKAEMKDAVAEGDADKAGAAAEDFAKQTAEQKVEPYASPADIAALNAWLVEHPEYQRPDIAQAAMSISAGIIAKTPGLPIQQVFDETHKTITKIFKEHFVNEDRAKPSAVESGGSRLTARKEAMPPEFKKAMEDYGKRQANYGPYKGKSGEGFDADKKLAMAGYKKAYERGNAA